MEFKPTYRISHEVWAMQAPQDQLTAAEKHGYERGLADAVNGTKTVSAAQACTRRIQTTNDQILDLYTRLEKLEAQVAEMKKPRQECDPGFWQNPKPAKPRRMKANPARNLTGHDVEHDESSGCDWKGAKCQPVDEPAKEGRWMINKGTRKLFKERPEDGPCTVYWCRPATPAEMFKPGARVKMKNGIQVPFREYFHWPEDVGNGTVIAFDPHQGHVLIKFDEIDQKVGERSDYLDLVTPAPEGKA